LGIVQSLGMGSVAAAAVSLAEQDAVEPKASKAVVVDWCGRSPYRYNTHLAIFYRAIQ